MTRHSLIFSSLDTRLETPHERSKSIRRLCNLSGDMCTVPRPFQSCNKATSSGLLVIFAFQCFEFRRIFNSSG
ncbi:hypothetical protein BJX99DRAFT_228625 [Aspergillus californicus]